MNHKGTTTLETERLILRRFSLDDADAVFKNWAGDPDVTTFMTWPPHKGIKASTMWCEHNVNSYANDDYYSWVIVSKASGEPIGSIGVVKSDEKVEMAEVGFCIGKAWWNQGYTSEALSAVAKYLFEEVGINRLEAQHDPLNSNSGKVMMKAGLEPEGIRRQASWNNQGIHDSMGYALLAKDYFSRDSSS
jgi:ribosomal-protein-alanine N-acetyltransferase